MFTPLYLLNNSYCEIFFKCLQIVRFVVDSKYFRPQTRDLERGCSGILDFLKNVSQRKRIQYILERNLESRYDFFQPPLARKGVQSVQIM